MKAVPVAWWRGVYREEEKKKMEVKMIRNARKYAPLAELRSSLIKLSQSLMHGANPWRGKKRMNKFRR